MNKDVQELWELAESAIEDVTPYFREKYKYDESLARLRPRLETVGCWIPCDADNWPPMGAPNGMHLAIWVQAHPDYPRGGLYQNSGPLLVDSWVGRGKLGHDITHYMLIGEPTE